MFKHIYYCYEYIKDTTILYAIEMIEIIDILQKELTLHF